MVGTGHARPRPGLEDWRQRGVIFCPLKFLTACLGPVDCPQNAETIICSFVTLK